jgi:hypothetical protein
VPLLLPLLRHTQLRHTCRLLLLLLWCRTLDGTQQVLLSQLRPACMHLQLLLQPQQLQQQRH